MHRTWLLLAFLAPSIALAADTYTHSGRLLDATGAPLNGPRTLTITLYSDAARTRVLGSATQTVDLQQGHYTLQVTPDPGTESGLAGAYVAVSVDGTELVFEAVGAVPYATLAGRLVGRTLVDNGGVSEWSDGSGAPSCLAYRYPTGPDAYAGPGAKGDGLYKLDSDGPGPRAPFTAYCDMTTGGGGWTLTATIFDDDGIHNWHAFSEHWARGGAFGAGAVDPSAQEDGRNRAYGEVTGNEFMITYNGSPFVRTSATASCFGGGSMLRTFGQIYWNQEMYLECPVAFHDTTLGERALSCTAGTTNCGTISLLRIGWGEDNHQNTTNSDQAMISSDRRNSVHTVGGLGSRKSDSGHQCGACIYGDVSGDTDAPTNIAGSHQYGLFIR